MIVRDAKREDVLATVAMLADDTLGRSRERFEDPLPQPYWDAFAAIEADPNNRLLVAEIDGSVAACLQLTFIPGLSRRGARRAQIESVRVASAHRGAGLGRRLIEAAIAEARRHGATIVQLTTDKTRADARRFYEGLGFVASHEGMKLSLD
jgi:ribosomal protein S18 acetylase RimI-like enzyme